MRRLPSIAGLLLACVLVAACASSKPVAAPGMVEGDRVVTFQVEGMACRNCAHEIARELEAVPGVRAAVIDFDTKAATIALRPGSDASMNDLHAAVDHWRTEHFSVKDDPDCLDPAKREELQRAMELER